MEKKFELLDKEYRYVKPISRIMQIKEERDKLIDDVEGILKRMRKDNEISKQS